MPHVIYNIFMIETVHTTLLFDTWPMFSTLYRRNATTYIKTAVSPFLARRQSQSILTRIHDPNDSTTMTILLPCNARHSYQCTFLRTMHNILTDNAIFTYKKSTQ